jgi:peptidoglycan/xylan/chitin deacetylase (PgdA/CDA1 family)
VPHHSLNLTFHGIGAPVRALDSGEERVWVGRERFLAVLDAAGNRDDVHLTFDDGNRSDVEEALPELRRRGLGASFFIVAGRIGSRGFLSEDDLRELDRAGMRIGSHGMHHVPWRELGDAELREELISAREALEQVLGHPVIQAACPFGSYDRRVLRSLLRAGYRRVYTSDCGRARHGDWLQARNTVTPDDDGLPEVASGMHSALHRQAKLAVKRWR